MGFARCFLKKRGNCYIEYCGSSIFDYNGVLVRKRMYIIDT